MQEIQEKILGYIEKNSRIDLKDLSVILGEDQAQVMNALEEMEALHIIAGSDQLGEGRHREGKGYDRSSRYSSERHGI